MNAEQLPLYKKAYDLHLRLFQITKNYQKEYKHNLAFRLIEHSLEILLLIYKSNSSVNNKEYRREMIELIIEELKKVQILSRISFDLKLINEERYAELIEITNNINKQSIGWRNNC